MTDSLRRGFAAPPPSEREAFEKGKVIFMSLRVGIDIGSTTVKVVVLDENNKLLFRSYERHYSKARERACETLRSIEDMLRGKDVRLVVTGSAGLGVAKAAGLDFVQEVYATAAAVNAYIPDTDEIGRASCRERV